jgi:hypothetical protein
MRSAPSDDPVNQAPEELVEAAARFSDQATTPC